MDPQNQYLFLFSIYREFLFPAFGSSYSIFGGKKSLMLNNVFSYIFSYSFDFIVTYSFINFNIIVRLLVTPFYFEEKNLIPIHTNADRDLILLNDENII